MTETTHWGASPDHGGSTLHRGTLANCSAPDCLDSDAQNAARLQDVLSNQPGLAVLVNAALALAWEDGYSSSDYDSEMSAQAQDAYPGASHYTPNPYRAAPVPIDRETRES